MDQHPEAAVEQAMPAEDAGEGGPPPQIDAQQPADGGAGDPLPAINLPGDQHAAPPPLAADNFLARLTQALERIGERAPWATFKAPKYVGTGDVEYFLDQFHEVAETNHWEDASTLIHLRESLKDEARECGRSQTIQGIEARLRRCFGMTPREARAKLATLKKHHKTSMQQHTVEISNLVLLRYAELENAQQRHPAVQSFTNSLGNPQLQIHHLAIAPKDIPTAVRACTEYLNIKVTGAGNVRQLGEEDTEDKRALSGKDRDTLDNLAKMVQELF